MYLHCPICRSIMNSSVYCNKCNLQIDRVCRVAYFTGVNPKIQRKYEVLNTVDWDGVYNFEFDEPMFDGKKEFIKCKAVTDMFEERLLQIIDMGLSISALEGKNKSDCGKYLFERWCLVNMSKPSEEAKKYFQILCSPTLEERVNRVWKVFPDVNPVERHNDVALQGFLINPTAWVELVANSGKEQLQAFEKVIVPQLLVTMNMITPKKLANVNFYKRFYEGQASLVLNDFKSSLIADIAGDINPPKVKTQKEARELNDMSAVLNPIVKELITPEYINSYGIEAKRKLLKEWGRDVEKSEEVVTYFWRELYQKIREDKLEKR